MNCQEAKSLVEAYADGELEAAAVRELEQHLQGCPACGRAWSNLQSLKRTLKQEALFFPAPAELRQRVKAALPSPARAVLRGESWWNWKWLGVAMSGAGAACLALLLAARLMQPSAEQALAREVVSSHIRSLMASHIVDVASTDQHTVKPWFNGRVDFSPPVRDLAAQEFPLIGGRLDYLGGHSVAALVFQRQKHVINLFIWPARDQDTPPALLAPRQGYHLLRWAEAGMAFWAASDLNEKELLEFARDYTAVGR